MFLAKNIFTLGRYKICKFWKKCWNESFDIFKYCKKEYNFFCQIYYYLKKIRDGNLQIDFDVLFEIFESEKRRTKLCETGPGNSGYIFLDELKIKLISFKPSGKVLPKDEKLRELFNGFPIDYLKLYNSIILN